MKKVDILDLRDKKISSMLEAYNAIIPKTEKELWKKIIEFLPQLSLYSDGTIKPTKSNLKAINTFIKSIKKNIQTKEYSDAVDAFISSWKDIEKLTNEYFEYKPDAKIKKTLQEAKEYSVKKTFSDLLDEGIDDNVVKPLYHLFNNGTLNSYSIDDLAKEIELFTLGDKNKVGRLERYTSQITSDSVTQYVATYSEILTEDLGLEFYIFSGNIQEDSRCFCKERASKFYHRKEVEAWGEGRVAVGNVKSCGFPWKGMIPGTNKSNIFIYRGGYNCEHYIIAVSTISVPKNVIIRAMEAGYYDPPKDIKTFFGI